MNQSIPSDDEKRQILETFKKELERKKAEVELAKMALIEAACEEVVLEYEMTKDYKEWKENQ